MKIQVVSDIHTEFMKFHPLLVPTSDILMMAGDIGIINTKSLHSFLDYVSQNWKRAYYTLGNHEFYHSKKTIEKLTAEYEELIGKYDNIYLLTNGKYYKEGNYTIIGNTLWSLPEYTNGINDFNKINCKNDGIRRKINLHEFRNLHHKDMYELEKYVMEHPAENILIMTHFPPIKLNACRPKYEDDIRESYFMNEIFKMHKKFNIHKNIKVWIYGHTHYSYTQEIDGILYISNQMGYDDELVTSRYNEYVSYEII